MSELPKGWIDSTVGDVYLNENGKRKPISLEVRANKQGSFPYYGATGIIDYLDSYTHDGEYILIGEDGANLLSKSKPLAFVAKGKYWVNNHAHTLKSPLDLPSRYLEYYINSLTLEPWVTGSAQPKLTKGNLEKIPLPLAPQAEQTRIVEKLDEVLAQVDTIKARLDGIPAILKRFRQSVLAAAVSGRILNDNVNFQTTDVGDPWAHTVDAPAHWELFEFKKAVKIVGGSQPPKTEFSDEDGDGKIRLIQIRDYKTDKFKVFIPLDKAKRFCSRDDIMIGRYGPPIFQILRGLEGAYNVALMKAEPLDKNLDKEYLYRFLQSPKIFNYIDAGSDRTAGQTGVNKKFLESYPIFVPPMEEQKEIVRLVDQYFAFADTIEAQVKKAQARVNNLTQSILAKAFRGELVAQDPNDEPAEKLLERIAQARKEAEALAKAAKKVAKTK